MGAILISGLFSSLIKLGRLTVIDAHGRAHVFGSDPRPAVTIRLHDPALHWRLALRPELAAGEAYMDGTLTIEDASLYDFLELIGRNQGEAAGNPLATFAYRIDRLFRRVQQFNPATRARRNVAHHYELSDELFESFLDRDRQYSCGYFAKGSEDLETAQEQKKQHIAAKLRLMPGMRVLDIGCGWGGLACYLAERLGARVTGITLAERQLTHARARAARAGLAGRVDFQLKDYRHETGRYDRIVSVGMFEHVGVGHYDAFLRRLHDLLEDDGIALLHTIGRAEPPGHTNAWLRKYVFPGGYSPALSEVSAAIERSRLFITDVETWRMHYALTLRQWRQRFLANRERMEALYDERFCRMWEFYLAGCEVAFRYLRLVVFQVQLAKSIDALPLVRDYMFDAERALRDEGSRETEAAA